MQVLDKSVHMNNQKVGLMNQAPTKKTCDRNYSSFASLTPLLHTRKICV